jgi:hypothetical protein
MQWLNYSIFSIMLGAGLFLAASPALAADARLWVYVQVYNDSRDNYDERDFTIEVDGENASPEDFRGSRSGTRVNLDEGRYEVEVRNDRDYRVSYSPECEGRIYEDDTNHCYVTLRGETYHVPGYQYPNYQQPVYQQPVYTAPTINLQKGYIPRLPSTGFAPVSSLAAAFAALALLGFGALIYPHARKAFAAVTR